MTIQTYINECLKCAEIVIFRCFWGFQEIPDTAQKLIYLFSAADMIYEMRY